MQYIGFSPSDGDLKKVGMNSWLRLLLIVSFDML